MKRSKQDYSNYSIIDNWLDDLISQGKLIETTVPILRGDIFKLVDNLSNQCQSK